MEEMKVGDVVTVSNANGSVTGTVSDIGTRGRVTELMLTDIDKDTVGDRVCLELTENDSRTLSVA